jgi:oligopeptide/dipeptide ABC transporter ATP-binding protein
VEAIFRDPRDPYTQGLLASIPRLGRRMELLTVIPGTVPNPIRWPGGCRFHTRCPHAWELCRREAPPLFRAGTGDVVAQASGAGTSAPTHDVRCWLETHPERRASP